MIKLKNILLEDRLTAMKDRLKLSDDDVLYLKSLNVPDKYIIWLANQYKLSIKEHGSDRIFKEDAYKYQEALKQFYELSNKNKITDKNINNYKDIFALYDVIEQFKDHNQIEIEKIDGADVLFENDEWLVVIPRTPKAARYYGRGTHWCTTQEHNFHYYNNKGDIYSFINKKDKEKSCQLHIEESQFKDIEDADYDINRFKKDNPELVHIFDIANGNAVKNFIKELKYDTELKRYDCNGDITIPRYLVKDGKLLISFGEIKGDFDCSYNNLETLDGAPYAVNGNFNCAVNNLKSLKGGPEEVRGNFNCSYNKLKTLKYSPQILRGGFDCSHNKLETLEGTPERINGFFNCANNELKTLKGGPYYVDSYFACSQNKLKTLEGGPRTVHGDFYCERNYLESLEGSLQWIDGSFNCSHNNLKTLEGGPRIVHSNFYCRNNNLETLKGAPEIVNNNFHCNNNPGKFTEEDVKKVCDVKRYIIT